MEITASELAKLSSLETAVSEHGCVADTDPGDFPIGLGDHIEDFGQYEQPSFTSHHSTGYIPSKYLSESISDMSFPLASTPLSACQDKMLVDTQFSANNTVPSLASFNEDLAQTEQLDEGEDPFGDGNHGIEMRTVEPVSHDYCRFYEGEELVFVATYTEVRGCKVDTTQEIQDSIKKLQSAPILRADHSQNLGESVPFPEICQAATLPWPHHDDDDGGPRAGPVQPPDGPLHAALG